MKILFEEDDDLKELDELNDELNKSESSGSDSDEPVNPGRDYGGKDIDAELADLGFGGEDQKDLGLGDLGSDDLGGDDSGDLDEGGSDLGGGGSDLGGGDFSLDDMDDTLNIDAEGEDDLDGLDDMGGGMGGMGGGGMGGFDVGMDDDGTEDDNAGGEDLPLPKPEKPEKPTWEPVELPNKKDYSVKRTDGFSLRARKIPSLPNTWIAQLYTKGKELSKGWVTVPKGHEPEEYITALANAMLDKDSFRYQQSGIPDEDEEEGFYGEEDLENPEGKEFGEEGQEPEEEPEEQFEGFDLEQDLGE
jgi:hypothetical protein